MDLRLIALIVLAIAIATVLIVSWAIARNEKAAKLRRHSAQDHARAMPTTGVNTTETVVRDGQRRVRTLPAPHLAAEERKRLIIEWRMIQSQFIDDPRSAVEQADFLAEHLMAAYEYPPIAAEPRSTNISLAHSSFKVIKNYHIARELADRFRQGKATPEDIRTAIVSYRLLFDELLDTSSIAIYQEVA